MEQKKQPKNSTASKSNKSKPSPQTKSSRTSQSHPTMLLQRAINRPDMLNPSDIIQLQRTLGNSAVIKLLKARPTPTRASQKQPLQRQTQGLPTTTFTKKKTQSTVTENQPKQTIQRQWWLHRDNMELSQEHTLGYQYRDSPLKEMKRIYPNAHVIPFDSDTVNLSSGWEKVGTDQSSLLTTIYPSRSQSNFNLPISLLLHDSVMMGTNLVMPIWIRNIAAKLMAVFTIPFISIRQLYNPENNKGFFFDPFAEMLPDLTNTKRSLTFGNGLRDSTVSNMSYLAELVSNRTKRAELKEQLTLIHDIFAFALSHNKQERKASGRSFVLEYTKGRVSNLDIGALTQLTYGLSWFGSKDEVVKTGKELMKDDLPLYMGGSVSSTIVEAGLLYKLGSKTKLPLRIKTVIVGGFVAADIGLSLIRKLDEIQDRPMRIMKENYPKLLEMGQNHIKQATLKKQPRTTSMSNVNHEKLIFQNNPFLN